MNLSVLSCVLQQGETDTGASEVKEDLDERNLLICKKCICLNIPFTMFFDTRELN